MIEQILAWFSGEGSAAAEPADSVPLALCALLVEAANSDDHFDPEERKVIAELLERRFKLSPARARALLKAGERAVERSAELFHFTRIINERLLPEQRVELIEMLWEVTYADGVLDQFEDTLLRRIGGLIYIPDRERGLARQRVLKRRGLDNTV
jgi:uncharacterized tellurite resistance protein B-like protein